MRLQLSGGSDVRRTVLASGQRSENLFPEKNSEGAASAETLYQRPGRRFVSTAAVDGAWRGLYQCAGGRAFGVLGTALVEINQDFTFTPLGNFPDLRGPRVAMQDNRQTLWVAQVSGPSFTLDLTTPGATLQPLVDPDGVFGGTNRFEYLDTYILWNNPGQNSFSCTLSNTITPFDDTYTAAMTSGNGNLMGIAVTRGNIMLIGERQVEIWTDVGAPAFPFARVPNATLEHGCYAPYSIITSGESTYWIGQDRLGLGCVFCVTGYRISVVSNRGVELSINRLSPALMANCVSYAHQMDGHRFVIFNFPGTPLTWAFDETTQEWHRITFGGVEGDRLAVMGLIHGQMVGGDRDNSNFYMIDPLCYTDNYQPIVYLRTFPHIASVPGPMGLQSTDGKVLEFKRFTLDIEVGTGDGLVPPEVTLRYSSDRGKTFGQDLLSSTGALGEYETSPTWAVLGRARDMVFEVQWSYGGPVALQGAWIDVEITSQ